MLYNCSQFTICQVLYHYVFFSMVTATNSGCETKYFFIYDTYIQQGRSHVSKIGDVYLSFQSLQTSSYTAIKGVECGGVGIAFPSLADEEV